MSKRYALIERRKQLGLSQRAFVERIRVERHVYRDIENGIKNPSVEQLAEIGGALNIGWNMLFAVMNIIDYDMNIYSKNENLKLVWIFTGEHSNRIGILRVEDSYNQWKDLSLDEFSNILYYRKINGYAPNIIYEVQDSIDLKLWYLKDKSNSLLRWCNSNGSYGKYIIKHAVIPYGITLEDFYRRSRNKIKLKCDKGHEYEQVVANITRYEFKCPQCNIQGTSYIEQFIYQSLKQIYHNCKNRYKINGYEIDVYIPEIKTCIEYNGQAWHIGREEKDAQKKEHILSLGYRFIVIHEHQEKGDISFNEDEIQFYYTHINRDCKLEELVKLIIYTLLKEGSKLIDFKRAASDAWEYSKGKIPYEESVAYKYPELLEEWYSYNAVKLDEVTPGSGERVKWICKNCGNEWETSVRDRAVSKHGCSCCGFNIFTGEINKFSRTSKYAKNSPNNALKVAPELEQEFLPELNGGKKLSDYTYGSNAIITWKCKNCGNTWNTDINSRIHKKSGCKHCRFNVFTGKINNTAIKRAKNSPNNVIKICPELKQEFLSELNQGKKLSDYTSGSNVVLNWKCVKCGNVWNAAICNRTYSKTGCPSCGYNIFSGEINKYSITNKYAKNSPNSILKVAPELEKEFLSELNEGKQLSDYTYGSHNEINWKCIKCSCVWNTAINTRVHQKSGCPACGYNIFTGSINKLSIRIKRTKKQTRKKNEPRKKKEPVLIVNGVEYYL